MRKMYVYMLAACVFAVNCAQIDTVPAASGEGEIIEIRQGNVGRFGELSMGLVKVMKSDYTTDVGEKKHGLVAVLGTFINGNPPQEKQFEVYAGQTVKMGKYSVYVQEIRSELRGSITLRVRTKAITGGIK